MAASDNLNPNQLRMFMSAQELHDTHSIDVMQDENSMYGGHWKSMDAMWKVKQRENKADGLDKSVAAHGVHSPVELTSGQDVKGEVIENGHHRIQAAYKHDPQMLLPVQHNNLDERSQDIRRRAQEPESHPVIPEWEDKPRFPSYP